MDRSSPLRPQTYDLSKNPKLTRMIGIMAGNDVDLAQNIVLALAAVWQRRHETNVGVVDNGYQFLPIGVEILGMVIV